MVNQFPHKDVQSPCPDVQQVWNEYNHIADSISTMTCHVSGGAGGAGGEGISAKVILNKTRQIDALVSRYLLSSDPIERRDIIQQIESIIKSTNASVSGQRAYSTEQQKALNLYHEAVRYYQRRCQ